MAFRIAFDLVAVVSALLMPWWFTAVLVVVLLFLFRDYYESLLLGFIVDIVFSAPTALFNDFQFVFTAVFAALFIVSLLVRRQLREDIYVS